MNTVNLEEIVSKVLQSKNLPASIKKLAEVPIPAVKNRPVCPNCLKSRQVEKAYTDPGNYRLWGANKPSFDGWRYTGYGFFCQLRCGTEWANKTMSQLVNGKMHFIWITNP